MRLDAVCALQGLREMSRLLREGVVAADLSLTILELRPEENSANLDNLNDVRCPGQGHPSGLFDPPIGFPTLHCLILLIDDSSD